MLTVGDYTENTNSFAQNIGTWRVGQSIKVFGLNTKDITEYDYTTVGDLQNIISGLVVLIQVVQNVLALVVEVVEYNILILLVL